MSSDLAVLGESQVDNGLVGYEMALPFDRVDGVLTLGLVRNVQNVRVA